MSAATRSFFLSFIFGMKAVPRQRTPKAQDKLNPLRFLRKHKTAFLALAAYHFIFFFPTLFMHRVVSPNDVFYNFDPWSMVRKVDVQNSLLNDPPTSYFTLMSLLKNDRRAFHWN